MLFKPIDSKARYITCTALHWWQRVLISSSNHSHVHSNTDDYAFGGNFGFSIVSKDTSTGIDPPILRSLYGHSTAAQKCVHCWYLSLLLVINNND